MKALVFLAFFSLTGCATEGNVRSTMNRIVDSWRGASESEVVAQWGQPQSRKQAAEGVEVLEWRVERTGIAPGMSYTTAARDPGGYTATTITRPPRETYDACFRRLTFKSGFVSDVDWEGNACCYAAIAGMCRSWLNPKR